MNRYRGPGLAIHHPMGLGWGLRLLRFGPSGRVQAMAESTRFLLPHVMGKADNALELFWSVSRMIKETQFVLMTAKSLTPRSLRTQGSLGGFRIRALKHAALRGGVF